MLKYLPVFTGSSCSNECIHCPHQTRQGIELPEIEGELSKGAGLHGVELYGGEPLARFDSSRLLGVSKESFRRVKVVSNGRALAKWEVAQSVLQSGATAFEIKLWGAGQQLHDSLTGVNGSFYETIQGISNIVNTTAKPFVAIKALVCEENLGQLPDMARAAVSLRADRFIIKPMDGRLSLPRAAQTIKLAVETAITNRVWASTEGVPLCVMGGYEVHVAEVAGEREPKTKVGACSECVYDQVCPGVDEKLAERFSQEAAAVETSEIISDLRELNDAREIESPAYNV